MIIKEPILSAQNKTFKAILKEKDGKGTYFLADGFHLAEEAAKASLAIEIYYSGEPLAGAPVPQRKISQSLLKRLSSTVSPEGIVTRCKKPIPTEEVGDKVLYLDGIQDPGNVGTILRTALAFGYRDVFFGPKTASPYNPKSVLSSQGAIFHLSLRKTAGDGIDVLLGLKESGYAIYGTSLRNSTPISDLASVSCKHILILGNEGSGVRQSLLDLSTTSLLIPIEGIDSLNVGVAGGILMYALAERGKE